MNKWNYNNERLITRNRFQCNFHVDKLLRIYMNSNIPHYLQGEKIIYLSTAFHSVLQYQPEQRKIKFSGEIIIFYQDL